MDLQSTVMQSAKKKKKKLNIQLYSLQPKFNPTIKMPIKR